MNKLLDTNKKAASIPDESDALIQFHDRPYIAYEEINLTKTMDIYLSGILRSEQALRMGVLPSPYQQEFEIATGTQSLTVTFQGAQRQFEWLEISLVYDKSNQHLTIYDSYDLELAAKLIKSVKFENTSTTYSLTGKLEYDINKNDELLILYEMFLAYQCNDFSTAPLSQYTNNEIYQEITTEENYTMANTDERILIDLQRSKGYTDELEKITRDDSGLGVADTLKKAAAKKMRFRIVGYSQVEYWLVFSNKGYIMSYQNYNISKEDEI